MGDQIEEGLCAIVRKWPSLSVRGQAGAGPASSPAFSKAEGVGQEEGNGWGWGAIGAPVT